MTDNQRSDEIGIDPAEMIMCDFYEPVSEGSLDCDDWDPSMDSTPVPALPKSPGTPEPRPGALTKRCQPGKGGGATQSSKFTVEQREAYFDAEEEGIIKFAQDMLATQMELSASDLTAEQLLEQRDSYMQWLTLLANTAPGEDARLCTPTLAVEAWWSCHLIRPVMYAAFCTERFGKIIDRGSAARTAGAISETQAALLETESASVGASAGADADAGAGAGSDVVTLDNDPNMIKATDIIADRVWWEHLLAYTKLTAAEVQSLPFLKQSYSVYRKWMSIWHSEPMRFVGCHPTIPVDIFWHSHQMQPKMYAAYCAKITPSGGLIPHMPWPQLTEEQKKERRVNVRVVWRETCGTDLDQVWKPAAAAP